jgi:P27 family predicted phage terminase small subunit
MNKRPSPPKSLSAESRALWRKVVDEHVIADSASIALVRQLCDSLDGLRACQQRIREDGLMIIGSRGQMRPHPLLASEAEYRRSFLATVRALRLDLTAEY